MRQRAWLSSPSTAIRPNCPIAIGPSFGAFDEDQLVGTISAYSFDLSVPGDRTLPITPISRAPTGLRSSRTVSHAPRHSNGAADISLDAKTLAACYLGGCRINTLAGAGRIDGFRDAARLGDRMFAGERDPIAREIS
jgi:hypothetical protein